LDYINAKLLGEKLGEVILGSETKSDQLFCYSRAVITFFFLGLGELFTGNYTTPDQQLCDALFHAKLAIGKSPIILKDSQPVNAGNETMLCCLTGNGLEVAGKFMVFSAGLPGRLPVSQS